VTFTSQYGVVRVADLPVVSGAAKGEAQPPAADPAGSTSDVFVQIEKLAELHQKGVLSDQEFATKKAELLQRI
jgi:Short C-terminal domain